jgi:hypothetical protein
MPIDKRPERAESSGSLAAIHALRRRSPFVEHPDLSLRPFSGIHPYSIEAEKAHSL